jgi:hypothetical protein
MTQLAGYDNVTGLLKIQDYDLGGGGGGPAARSSAVLSSAVTVGGTLTVPEYEVGSKRLMMFWDGLLAEPGGQYTETGQAGTASTTVTAATAIPAGTRLTFMVI